MAACPICHKLELPTHQDLLCGNCVHSSIEHVRNSVIENERVALALRREINAIFAACDARPGASDKRTQESGKRAVLGAARTSGGSDALTTSEAAVKSLALQLWRLKILDVNIKLQGIERARKTTEDKIAAAETRCGALEAALLERERAIDDERHRMEDQYKAAVAKSCLDAAVVRSERVPQIQRQVTRLQHAHYVVLRELVFSGRPRASNRVKLFHQPVIRLSTFLSHNNKVDAINTFLENLVCVLMLFKDLFFPNEPSVLPYLPYLQSLLPDESFYASVQEEIAAISNEREIETGETSNGPTVAAPIAESVSFAKVVICNNTIRIPMSSRTANLSRRASVRHAEKAARESETSPTPPSQASTRLVPSVLEGKKIIIVPHKILTQPFTRLKTQEYLKFVLVLVKILVSFNSILREIDARMPPRKLKHSRSMMDTLNSLRFRPKITDSPDYAGDVVYDIPRILFRLATLDERFHGDSDDSAFESCSTKSTFAASSNDVLLALKVITDSSLSTSIVNIHSSQVPRQESTPRFYAGLLSKARRQPEKFKSVDDANIYGMVSESHSDSSSSLRASGTTRSQCDLTGDELKMIAHAVHTLISEGGGMLAAPKLVFRRDTMAVMEQSRAQLHDWDVVSQMY